MSSYQGRYNIGIIAGFVLIVHIMQLSWNVTISSMAIHVMGCEISSHSDDYIDFVHGSVLHPDDVGIEF
jgi:hypothetical protein